MKELIVNADDFGLHPAINAGVRKAHQHGIVTAASLLANGEAYEEAITIAQQDGLDTGIHLTLTGGAPVSAPAAVPSLLDDNLEFHPTISGFLVRYFCGSIRLAEVEVEWRHQIQRMVDSGLRPSHLDGHQHVHLLPRLFELCLRLADDFNIRYIRAPEQFPFLIPAVPLKRRLVGGLLAYSLKHCPTQRDRPPDSPNSLMGMDVSGHLNLPRLQRMLDLLPAGVSELHCHPALGAGQSSGLPDWGFEWDIELESLSHPKIRQEIDRLGISLRSFVKK